MKFTTLVCGLIGAAGMLAAHTAAAQQHVTDEMLRTAQEDPNNWLMATGNYTGNRFSKLGQINTGNVRNLVPKWIFSLGVLDAQNTTPVVICIILFANG